LLILEIWRFLPIAAAPGAATMQHRPPGARANRSAAGRSTISRRQRSLPDVRSIVSFVPGCDLPRKTWQAGEKALRPGAPPSPLGAAHAPRPARPHARAASADIAG